MSYLQYNDYYRKLILSGQIPFPPYYLQTHVVPNIVNENCNYNDRVDWPIVAYPYIFGPNHEVCNLSYCAPDLSSAKYDYINYTRIPYNDPSTSSDFRIIPLVSNIPCRCDILDVNLLDPWNSIIINDIIYVACAGAGLIVTYNLRGAPLPQIINVFDSNNCLARPTGIVNNCNLRSFMLYCSPNFYPSMIIVATRNGTINGYNCAMDPNNSIVIINNCNKNCVYTGLELAENKLFAVDFYNKKIDVFNAEFKLISAPFDTSDPDRDYSFMDGELADPIPEDFSPYNIVNLNDLFYVLYARQNPRDNQAEFIGRGEGYINIFTLCGKFIKRFFSRGVLNAPYGLIQSPDYFGYPAGAIIVGNFGDGNINVFSSCGEYIGNMRDSCSIELSIEGLRGLTRNYNCQNLFYWNSSANNLRNAYMGTINTSNFC